MTLYSLNGSYPIDLAGKTITLSSGATRNDVPWQPISPEDIADAGYVAAPDQPAYDPASQALGWDGENWTVEALPAPASANVDEEHDRRAMVGKAFTIAGYGDVALEGSLRTQTVLLALKDTARDLAEAGITNPVLMLTDRDNVDHYLTAAQVVELVNAGKQYMQQLHAAKRTLKEAEPIPADFADDAYWPAV